MRICLIYDCLYPHTVGGAERWYRNLAERLAADGHDVTYLTRRQWPRGTDPGVPGVKVIAVAPNLPLYVESGRRSVVEPLVFGLGTFLHLLRKGRRYDVVHTASFPYFHLLVAALLRPLGGYRLVVDWHEVWTREYWREYLGRIGGTVGYAVQRLCLLLPQSAFCMVLRSRSEGYGLIVVEASAQGTPSVVVRDPNNAATELVEEGVNGFIADSASPDDLAGAILRVHEAGPALRESTADWFARNAERLSLGHSIDVVADAYRDSAR